jgi:hypothetical protein
MVSYSHSRKRTFHVLIQPDILCVNNSRDSRSCPTLMIVADCCQLFFLAPLSATSIGRSKGVNI